MSQLPLHQCHKRVRAAKIISVKNVDGMAHFCLEGGVEIPADAAWLTRNPKSSVGGYFVEYEDGYTAYSPAEPFEAGYSPVPVNDAPDQPTASRLTLAKEIERTINCYSAENGSNTPDFILAEYLMAVLVAFDGAVNRRENWYGRGPQAVETQCTCLSGHPDYCEVHTP